MPEKTLKTRIIHKHDVESNWSKATGFVPKQGELIVYDKDSNYDYERVKIGDGATNVNNLPFVIGTLDNQPDWNQNDPNAKDYIKNRPGGYAVATSLEITWDGDMTGKETIAIPVGMTLVKIADEAPSIEKFAVGTSYKAIVMTEVTFSNGRTNTVQNQIDLQYEGDFWMCSDSSAGSLIVGVTANSVNIQGLTLTKGLWFSISNEEGKE